MDKNMKKAITKNRVKLLGLDYFDLTGPLLASEIFPSKKHKEIKGQAMDSKARVDLLLEWMEDSAPKEAFPIFLQGIRNCKELILAKKIKREASGKEATTTGTVKPKSNAASSSSSGLSLDALLADIVPTLPASISAASAKPIKLKTPKQKPASASSGGVAPPINGLPAGSVTLPPPQPPKAKKRKADGEPKLKLDKPKARKTTSKQQATKNDNVPGSRGSTPKGTAASAAASAAAIMATPRATRKSSSSDIVQTSGKKAASSKSAKPQKTISAKKTKTDKKDTASSSPNKTKSPKTAVTAMTFKEVEEKQQDFKNKFKFTNANAVARSILFKDKSDVTYLGCPLVINNKQCGKRVELKSKEFICEAKHKSPNCRQIPRLQVNCSDGTGELVLTLFKNNVETFLNKSETDIETMSVDEIKSVLDTTVGRKLNVEVTSEKAKKGSKKGAAVKWNNVATIINDSDAPPNKKKRKN